jgi:hypothetical protein
MFQGEQKRGEHEEAGVVDRTFWVVISRGRGMKVDPGMSLVEDVAGGPPMFELVEAAREVLRGLTFDSETTEESIDYKSCEPFVIDGFLQDAYKLEFSIGCQLPAAAPQYEDAAK